MSAYGSAIPKKGRELIAAILAASAPLELTRIKVGKGKCPDEVYPGDLEDLIEPVADGTSTTPYVDGDTVKLTVEYRSDLNGGLEHGFWLNEFGVFARGRDGSDVMVFYGTLGDYPQWVCALRDGIDTRRFDVQITIGEGATVVIHYKPSASVTPEDLQEALERGIADHDQSSEAHEDLRQDGASLHAAIAQLYSDMVAGEVSSPITGDNGEAIDGDEGEALEAYRTLGAAAFEKALATALADHNNNHASHPGFLTVHAV